MKFRKLKGRYHYRKRFLTLNSNERDEISTYRKLAMLYYVMRHMKELTLEQHEAGMMLTARYCACIIEPDISLLSERINRTIDSFSESDCWIFFKFRKNDLNRLLNALQIPVVVTAETSNFSGEELLLACLYRLSNKTLHDISQVFGREYSQWGKAWRWFIRYIRNRFEGHMMDNLPYWQPTFDTYDNYLIDFYSNCIVNL
jgi:hypothetical protein